MPADLSQMALMRFLETRNSSYYGKVIEVSDEVAGWLTYIPQTFPHYTRHTIAHSEEIISQLSQLLFEDGDLGRPALPQLSAVEAFILIVAAFLHDSGMVASDDEKKRILATAEWHAWTESGGGASRWQEIAKVRANNTLDAAIANFIADIQVRYLLAEFIRRRHHLRSGDFIRHHQDQLGRFAFNDRVLTETVASVCIAHGLAPHELADHERFPDRRDIRGEKVNVRLMAILLRLGDLLDMSSDRACPLLLNAACPLPPESLAHWSQYQRITHRMTAPDIIEIRAQCNTQDEHRYLHDWCRWLVSETHEAVFTLRDSKRHVWQAPRATLDETNASIRIDPSPDANYLPRTWTFELDHAAVFQRLIYDAYEVPHVFLRELLQNAADASRCRMYDELRRVGQTPPALPTDVPDIVRNQYPISIASNVSAQPNALSGETEFVQTLTIADNGIGMDVDTIQRYFLQVGRSFYTTDEFKREYGFAAASRFGIGFLSVFAEADDVEVDTLRAGSFDGPLKLRLIGPRSFFTVERGTRTRPGTSIRAKLKSDIADDTLIRAIRHWCKALEFPVEVVTASHDPLTIMAERPDDFCHEVTDLSAEGARFVVRPFPVDEAGIRGHIYVEASLREDRPESWLRARDALTYRRRYPAADFIYVPPGMSALHGINLESDWRRDHGFPEACWSARIDDRSSDASFTIARSSNENPRFHPSVTRALRRIIAEHVARMDAGGDRSHWRYLQGLITNFGLANTASLPGSVPILAKGRRHFISVDELLAFPSIVIALHRSRVEAGGPICTNAEADLVWAPASDAAPVIDEATYRGLSSELRSKLTTSMSIDRVLVRDQLLLTQWKRDHASRLRPENAAGPGQISFEVFIADIAGTYPVVGCWVASYSEILIVSDAHPFGQWLLAIREAAKNSSTVLTRRLLSSLPEALMGSRRDRSRLKEYLESWAALPDLQEALKPAPMDVEELSTVLYVGPSDAEVARNTSELFDDW